MTPDTKAIVEKLTSEGLLLRNRGTNSIKSVKVELNKFHDTFKALSSSMQGITGTLQGQTKLEELRDEREAKIELLDDKERKDFEKAEKENIKSQQKLDSQKLAQDLKLAKEREQKDFKVFGKNGIFASTLSGAFNVIKKTLFFGVVGAIGYQVLAGAVEAIAPKYFGKDVKMPDLFDGFSRAGTALSKITSGDWDGLVENIKAVASPLGMLGAGYVAANVAAKAVPAVGGAIVSGAAQYLTFKSMLKLVTPGAPDVEDGMKAARINPKLLKGGIAGLVFAGLYAAIDPIMNFMRGSDMTGEDIANTEIPTSYKVGGLATAATIASLFIPGGLLVRAAAGLAMFLVGGVLKAIDYVKDDDNLPNKIEEIYAQNMETEDQMERLLEQRKKAMQLGADPAAIEKQIADLKKKTEQDQKEFLETFDISTQEDQDSINKAKARMRQMLSDPEAYYAAHKYETSASGNSFRVRSQEDLQEKYDAEIQRLENVVAMNQGQLEQTAAFGSKRLGMSNEDMGLVKYRGTLMTVETRDEMIAANLLKKQEADKQRSVVERNAEFQEYLRINDIDFEGSYTDVALKAMNEQNTLGGLGGNGIINVFNQGGDTITPITMSTGGAKTATTILQGFNQGSGMGYCPVPGLLGT